MQTKRGILLNKKLPESKKLANSCGAVGTGGLLSWNMNS